MRNINKSATEPLYQPSQVSMKNKARPSRVLGTAFSFGTHPEPFMIHQINLVNRFIVIVFILRITGQNETSNNALISTKTIYVKTINWQP
jgi:hypothetical protein